MYVAHIARMLYLFDAEQDARKLYTYGCVHICVEFVILATNFEAEGIVLCIRYVFIHVADIVTYASNFQA